MKKILEKIKGRIKSSLHGRKNGHKAETGTSSLPVKRAEVKFAGSDASLLENLKGTYISSRKSRKPSITASVIFLVNHQNFEAYFDTVKKENYKSCIYPFNRSVKEGFYSKEFRFENFVPDIVEINHSIKERQGREMSDGYRRNIEELGGLPKKILPVPEIENPLRYRKTFGVFRKEDGRKQGEIVTGEQAVGYISFLREGNICLYSQILGHDDHLKSGIMYNLHFFIMKFLYEDNPCSNGIEMLMYGGHYQGNEGLIRWKEKLLFEPADLYLAS